MIDVQNGVVDGAPRRDEVIANINDVVERARASDVPVIWVQHQSDELPEGSEQWQYVPELKMADGEPVVHKRYGDSFEATTLGGRAGRSGGRTADRRRRADGRLRAVDAPRRLHPGYDATLVSDAHTTEDLTEYGAPPVEPVIAHTNLVLVDARRRSSSHGRGRSRRRLIARSGDRGRRHGSHLARLPRWRRLLRASRTAAGRT